MINHSVSISFITQVFCFFIICLFDLRLEGTGIIYFNLPISLIESNCPMLSCPRIGSLGHILTLLTPQVKETYNWILISKCGLGPVRAMGSSKGCLTWIKVVLSMVNSTLTTDSGGCKAKLECTLL